MGENGQNSMAKLIDGVRIIIYSYMTVDELINKISEISKKDRAMLAKKNL